MKPGGSKNLDMIVNGLPSYVWGGGEVAARLVTGLVSGKQPTYTELLTCLEMARDVRSTVMSVASSGRPNESASAARCSLMRSSEICFANRTSCRMASWNS